MMAAADWARGARLEPGESVRMTPAARTPTRRATVGATTRCAPSARTTPTPTSCCRRCSRPAVTGATPRSPPSSSTARCAGSAATTRSSARCVDAAAGQARPAGARRAAARRAPAARHAGPVARGGRLHGRPGAGEGRPRAGRIRQRCAAQGRRARPCGWLADVAPDGETDPVGHLAVARSHPRWMVEAFRDALGGDLRETESALAADNERPTVHAGGAPGQGGRRGAASRLALSPAGGRRSRRSSVRRRAGRRCRRCGRTGPGCRTRAASWSRWRSPRAPLEGRDARWLDLCAGPGGKAALLGGARRAARRPAARGRAAAAPRPAGGPCDRGRRRRTVVADATRRPPGRPARSTACSSTRPCSGLGALRRRPEARWRRRPSDVESLHRCRLACCARR